MLTFDVAFETARILSLEGFTVQLLMTKTNEDDLEKLGVKMAPWKAILAAKRVSGRPRV